MSLTFRRTSGSTRTPSYARRIAATAAIAGAGIALPLIAAGSASAASTSTWESVASCESGGDWSINTGNGFYGGLQFTESTWLAYGGGQYAQYANDATEGQQITVAEAVLASQGVGAWPVCGPQAGLSQNSGSPSVDTSGSTGSSSGSSSGNSGSTSSGSNSSGSSSSGSNSSGSHSSGTKSSGSSSSSATSSSTSGSSSSGSTKRSSSSSSPSGAPTASSGSRNASATGSYTVLSGDTLSGIAQKEGIADWHTLYAENTSVVGGNPDLIFPGQVLTLG